MVQGALVWPRTSGHHLQDSEGHAQVQMPWGLNPVVSVWALEEQSWHPKCMGWGQNHNASEVIMNPNWVPAHAPQAW